MLLLLLLLIISTITSSITMIIPIAIISSSSTHPIDQTHTHIDQHRHTDTVTQAHIVYYMAHSGRRDPRACARGRGRRGRRWSPLRPPWSPLRIGTKRLRTQSAPSAIRTIRVKASLSRKCEISVKASLLHKCDRRDTLFRKRGDARICAAVTAVK